MAELQKDPITRGDFLGFGILGAISGAILTIPPVAFIMSPVIKTSILGDSDVNEGWQRVGPVSEVQVGTPRSYRVDFPIQQSYGDRKVQGRFGSSEKSNEKFVIENNIWLSWKAPIQEEGQQGSGGDTLGEAERPAVLDQKSSGFTQAERDEILSSLNILSNSCAHLGCPVRWFSDKHEFLCPCHGGLYDINGGYVGGPPPRDMYRYTQAEIREDGNLYVKHEYDIEPGLNKQQPYVV